MADEEPKETERKGVFVIIKEKTHNFYFPTDEQHDNWNERGKLAYGRDVKRLLKTLNLTKESKNLFMGCDLTNDIGEIESQRFKTFMEKVLAYRPEKDEDEPSFLMLFLMSHGGEDGKFLLSTSCKCRLRALRSTLSQCVGKKKMCKEKTEAACCKGKTTHSYDEECQARDLMKDVISKICDHEKYKDKTKIFIIQTCRGSPKPAIKKAGQANGENTLGQQTGSTKSTDLFIGSKYEDTFVFRASVEGNASYVSDNGSLLLHNFCENLVNLREGIVKYEALEKITNEELKSQLCIEDITDGWLMNVCQRTAAAVSEKGHPVDTEQKPPKDAEQKYDKQQPHISSTLSSPFSLVKMMKHQQ